LLVVDAVVGNRYKNVVCAGDNKFPPLVPDTKIGGKRGTFSSQFLCREREAEFRSRHIRVLMTFLTP
jgi:hypothetical protein